MNICTFAPLTGQLAPTLVAWVIATHDHQADQPAKRVMAANF